jgi:hypothetical protein
VAGSHSLQSFVRSVARDVKDPQTGVSVDERARAAALASSDPSPRARQLAKAASDGKDLPLDPLGSGSDFSSFVHHLGIASLNVSFGGEGESGGVYHSAYDTWEHHSRFVDPGFAYAGALAKTTGRMVLRLADEALPVMRYTPVAETVAEYIDELQKLAVTGWGLQAGAAVHQHTAVVVLEPAVALIKEMQDEQVGVAGRGCCTHQPAAGFSRGLHIGQQGRAMVLQPILRASGPFPGDPTVGHACDGKAVATVGPQL